MVGEVPILTICVAASLLFYVILINTQGRK